MVEVTGISDKLVEVVFSVHSFPQITPFIWRAPFLYYFAAYKTYIDRYFLIRGSQNPEKLAG